MPTVTPPTNDWTAGSDGRVSVYVVPYDATTNRPTAAGAVTVPVGSISSWKTQDQIQGNEAVYHFEGPANARGVVYGQQIEGGTGKWTASIAGTTNPNPTGGTHTIFGIGAIVVIDFIYSKGQKLGRYANAGKVVSFESGSELNKTGGQPFTASIEGDGVLTDPTLGS